MGDLSNASYAIRFAASYDDIFMVLSGMSNLEQMEDNISYMKDFWNQDYYYEIHTEHNGKASDCIKCGMCEEVCPQHLEIRSLLEQVAEVFEGEKA